MSESKENDLLASLAPPPEDMARPIGTIDGPPGWHEGFGAGLCVWCGPLVGWRDMGDLVVTDAAVIARHLRRLTATLTFDLGEHILPRAVRVMAEAAEEENQDHG